MKTEDQRLSAAEASRRLGVSAKALRLYESRGLLAPVRTASGWRTYGPAEISVLHQILALKRLGLSLARVADLLKGRTVALDTILEAQETVLVRESARAQRALGLVRSARAKLASGTKLSVDDLINLTKETTVTTQAKHEELKAIFDPLAEKHFTPEELKALGRLAYDQDDAARAWYELMAEAKALLAKGNAASPEAMDLARRWMALVGQFTGGNPKLAAKAKAMLSDAMADPRTAPMFPLNPEIFAFVSEAWTNAQRHDATL